MSSCIRLSFAALSSVTTLASFACVDSEKTFGEFEDRVVDAAPLQESCPVVDFFPLNGEFLAAIQTPLGGPIRLVATLTTTATDSGGTVDLGFQALKVDSCSPQGNGGEPVGDPLPTVEGVPINPDGTFDFTQTGVSTPGEANPIICGADILADIQFIGCIQSETFVCGAIAGTASEPIRLDLSGSTFGAIQIETGTRGDANLPEPVVACPEG